MNQDDIYKRYLDQVNAQNSAIAAQNKTKGAGAWSALPSAAAAVASLIPGVGTGAAALLGGGGEALRQIMAGEDFNLGKVGGEAALSAIPGGLGKLGKFALQGRNAANVVKGAEAVTDIAKTGKVTAQENKINKIRSMFDRTNAPESATSKIGQKISNSTNGIKVGDEFGDTVLTADRAAELNSTIAGANKGGLVGRTQRQKIGGVQDAKAGLNTEVATTVGQTADKAAEARAGLKSFDPANPTHVQIDSVLAKSVAEAKTPEQLQALRQKLVDAADSNVVSAAGANAGVTKELAGVYIKSIDDALAKTAGATKQIDNLSDAEKILAKGANRSEGNGTSVIDLLTGKSNLTAVPIGIAKDTAGKVLQAAGSNAALPTYGRGLVAQVAGRGAAEAAGLTPRDEAGNALSPEQAAAGALGATDAETQQLLAGDPNAAATAPQSTSPFSKENIQQAILEDLNTGGRNVDTLLSLYKTFGETDAAGLDSATSKALGQSANGSAVVDQLQARLEAVAGEGKGGGVVANLLSKVGLNDNAAVYNDTAAASVTTLARALGETGVISDSDAKIYGGLLPKITDSATVRAAKWNDIRERIAIAQGNTMKFGAGADANSMIAQ